MAAEAPVPPPRELDMTEQDKKGFLSFFRRLPDAPSTVRFFERKELGYSVHGESAVEVARRFYRTTSVVRYLTLGTETLAGVTLNRAMFESVLRELLLESAQHTVELWGEERSAGWKLRKAASPGKLGAFEEELFSHGAGEHAGADAPAVVAVRVASKEGQTVVGAAYAVTASRELGALEFADDGQFGALEALLVQVGAKEVALPREAKPTPEGRRLRDCVSRCGALAVDRPAGDFSPKEAEAELSPLLGAPLEQHRAILEREQAAAAIAALLRHAEASSDDAGRGRWTLSLHDTGRYMRLDAAALRAINVLRDRADASDSFSLYGLMNRARTPMGRRLLLRWLKQPLVDVGEIGARHDVVEALVDDPELRDALRGAQLRQLPDVERVARKLERGAASLVDLCRLYQASCALPVISDSLARCGGPHAELLERRYAAPLREAHDSEHLGKFEALLEAAVDLDKIPDEYVICASYSPGLGEIQAEKDAVDRKIQAAWDDAAADLGLARDKQLKLDSNNQHGHFFRLTKKEETLVRARLKKYQVIEAKKDGTKFTCPALRRLSEARQELCRKYDRTQRDLVARVVDVASSFVDVFLGASRAVAELDVLAGFADLAACAPTPYVRPTMTPKGEGDIVLEGSRHPCVEVQDAVSFIPNDCKLARGDSWFQIITGPNMGGKSTFIRQVGVCVLMAQVGSFVPCTSASIAVRDAIFARVGAGDCQMRGISTFMAEMLETASILKAATPASLIIIDELGRGTSTYDGFGLAWAISEHIVEEVKAPCLFATHFHELTALQGACGVKNFHVEAHLDRESRKLTMLYSLKEGAASQSFGIHCAEFANFPADVLEMARAKAAELEDFAPPEAVASEVAADGVTAKRKRVTTGPDAEEGARRIRQFLSEFKALPLPSLEPAAAVEQVRAMRAQLVEEAEANPWLKETLQL